MVRLRGAIAAAMVFLLTSAPSAAQTLTNAYAGALVRFNPALNTNQARRLAAVALAVSDDERLDARLLLALIAVESSWKTQAVSRAGARGLGQLMPQTARDLAVNPDDADQNVMGAAHLLRRLLDHYHAYDAPQRYVLALAAYNAGPVAVDRYAGVPPYAETRAYVAQVMALWARLSGE